MIVCHKRIRKRGGDRRPLKYGRVQPLPEGSDDDPPPDDPPPDPLPVTVLRDDPGFRVYGYIDELEVEKWRTQTMRVHIVFFCLGAHWFDALADDLSDMPPVNAIATVARACMLDLVVTPAQAYAGDDSLQLADHESQAMADLESVHLSQGWWLEFYLHPSFGSPATIYFPAEGSDDPATIGNTPNEAETRAHTFRRVRPPSKLVKLHRFSHSAL